MKFRYVAYNLDVGLVRGVIEAASPEEGQAALVQQGYKPLSVDLARRLPGLDALFPSLFHVSKGELVRFTRQLATMLESGGNLVRILEMLHGETKNRLMRRILYEIRERLDEGESLSEALGHYPKVFSLLLISVVEVGEQTGNLAPALEQVATIMQKEQEAKEKAIRTMMYPLAIMGLSMLTLFVLMTVALPPLLKVFKQLDTDVPAMTRIALTGVGWVQGNFLTAVVGAASVVMIFALLRRLPAVRYWMDVIQTRLPLVGSFTVMGEISSFSRTTSLLLNAGVTLSPALQQGIKGSKNLYIKKALMDSDQRLHSGQPFGEALKRHKILPMMFVQFVVIGEETNALAKTLRDAAEAYQRQLEQKLDSFLGMLEPASTVLVGGIVGFIAFSMFVPIYSGMKALG